MGLLTMTCNSLKLETTLKNHTRFFVEQKFATYKRQKFYLKLKIIIEEMRIKEMCQKRLLRVGRVKWDTFSFLLILFKELTSDSFKA